MSHQTTPYLSVLMSVHNGAEHLSEAIDSILAQTFTDFEFIIIDDASTDNTAKILKNYASKDKRLRLVQNTVQMGLAASLNKGLNFSKAPLVARMDDDDFSLPDRLAKQLTYMENNPHIGICGSAVHCFDELQDIWFFPIEHNDIIAQLFLSNALAHPSVIMRREIILKAGGYDENFSRAQDYELWSRLAFDHHVLFHNLPEVLINYRVKHKTVFRQWHTCVLELNLNRFGIFYTPEQLDMLTCITLDKPICTLMMYKLDNLLNLLDAINTVTKSTSLHAYIREHLWRIAASLIVANKHNMITSIQLFTTYRLRWGYEDSLFTKIKHSIKIIFAYAQAAKTQLRIKND